MTRYVQSNGETRIPKSNTIDEYIAALPEPHANLLRDLRKAILEAVPDAAETFNYGVPVFSLIKNGKADQQIMIGSFTNHVGLYPHPDTIEVRQWSGVQGHR